MWAYISYIEYIVCVLNVLVEMLVSVMFEIIWLLNSVFFYCNGFTTLCLHCGRLGLGLGGFLADFSLT